MPALLTRMSRRPRRCDACLDHVPRTAALSVTSVVTAIALHAALSELGNRSGRLGFVAADDGDIGAGLGESAREAKTDAAIAPGDDRDFAAEIEPVGCHICIPWFFYWLLCQIRTSPKPAMAAP